MEKHSNLSDFERTKGDDSDKNFSEPPSPVFSRSASVGDTATFDAANPLQHEFQMKEWKGELDKVEDEIVMLRSLLSNKVRRSVQLKQNLGVTPFKEFKHDLQSGLSQIRESTTYQKTNEAIYDWNDKLVQTAAYQKTSAAVKAASDKTSSAFFSVGAVMTKKLGDIKNSSTFKSMEEKMAMSYANVKSRVAGSKSTDDISADMPEETGSFDLGGAGGTVTPTGKEPL